MISSTPTGINNVQYPTELVIGTTKEEKLSFFVSGGFNRGDLRSWVGSAAPFLCPEEYREASYFLLCIHDPITFLGLQWKYPRRLEPDSICGSRKKALKS